MIITGAINAQYFGMSRSFDRGTELKSGFVAVESAVRVRDGSLLFLMLYHVVHFFTSFCNRISVSPLLRFLFFTLFLAIVFCSRRLLEATINKLYAIC